MSDGSGGKAETRRLERREFERGHIESGEEPAPPRPAATVVVARRAGEEMEVLLLRRPDEASFAAGAYVFAGGRIDPEDEREKLLQRVDPAAADGEPEALVAAARELWEETGLLIGEPGTGRAPGGAAARGRLRRTERVPFRRLAHELDLRLPGPAVAYFARWITPERLSRRYDTRFFLALDPGGDVTLTNEHTDSTWLSPERALARFAAGSLPLLFPTRKTLERLSGYPDPETAITDLRAEPVEPVRPRLLVLDDGVQPLLPDDEGYEEAARSGGR